MPQYLSAQIAPAHHLNGFRFGLEPDFPKVKSDSFFFESAGFYAPWLHVPFYQGLGAYVEVPFAYVKPSESIRFVPDENEQVVAFNPLLGFT